ncbi:unnamed protein product [Vitrella brassicaformis CCMP3155]|uniref:Transmembrane protein n=1 Tax=Vitrella brassicaformis (strain CCMP3155) TaxID=1169540 RepID=A0A0G4GA52_VITBC|nr:unnamed protein product [Vitrella brassicaformis CCMP3155]|eukprot:CEM25748.1 unnamed protein product [Vitrella brassicaformis CCMP3155]
MSDDRGDAEEHVDTRESSRRQLRREERAITESVRDFREAAGYEAAYEEHPTILEYKTISHPDGSTTEVLVGAHFSPEPLKTTIKRVLRVILWQLAAAVGVSLCIVALLLICVRPCESTGILGIAFDVVRRILVAFLIILVVVHVTDGCSGRRIVSRLWRSRFIFGIPMIVSILISVANHARWDVMWRRNVIAIMWWCCLVVAPYAYFRSFAGATGMKNKQDYALKLASVSCLGFLQGQIYLQYVLPVGVALHDDNQRTQLALISLIVGWPLVSLANKLLRSIRDGPPTYGAPPISVIASAYLVIPRVLQARMISFGSKVMNSILIVSYDLITDLFLPHGILLYVGAKRFFLSGRCTKAPDESCDNMKVDVTDTIDNRETGSAFLQRQGTVMTTVSSSISSIGEKIRRSASTFRDVVSVTSAFASLELTPRYIRQLTEQMHMYSLMESTVLVATNLAVMVGHQVLPPGPSLSIFLKELGALIILVLLEAAAEAFLFVVMIRWHNLPLTRSEEERGVLWNRTLVCLWANLSIALGILAFFYATMARVVNPDGVHVEPSDFCPHFSFVHE